MWLQINYEDRKGNVNPTAYMAVNYPKVFKGNDPEYTLEFVYFIFKDKAARDKGKEADVYHDQIGIQKTDLNNIYWVIFAYLKTKFEWAIDIE